MDLETRNINGILEPYCVNTYFVDSDGLERSQPFYLTDYNSPNNMLSAAINSLLYPKFNGYTVYLHNFSNFDGIFLIRIFSELKVKVKPIIRDGRIINITLKFGYNFSQTIKFRDSLLLLTGSLADLAKDFEINYNKGIFPYNFVNNPEIKLNYIGEIPEFKYFEEITLDQYNEYCSTKSKHFWDLEFEAKYYCHLDCKILYLVLVKFGKIIFDLFQIDFTKYPTLPSNTMAIFRSNFLKDEFKIPLINGSIYNDLKKAYTGGMVDVYKPTNDPETKVNIYDVNSLYPYSMDHFAMPVGTPVFFEGDIFKVNPNAFGVFEVEVETPNNLKYPVLQVKVKTDKGDKTISPLGTWTGWYFSEEIFNAMKFGYKFKVLRGYLFEKGYIFKDFVIELYKIKANSKKGTPMYLIAKLLLNSLYGKLGMDPDTVSHLIINSDKSQIYNHKYIVTNVIDLGNNKELITYYNKSNKEQIKPSSEITSVSIALAVTAYARIYMSQLKQIALVLGLIIFYMDTDSLAISGLLPPEFVSKELGKLKLEHVFNEVVFLAPKVYGGKTDSYENTKVKGLKNHITFNELKPLLTKDNSLTLNQEKWLKNIGKGHISVKKELYTLMITENKRQLIFNKDNVFVDTKPLVLSKGEVVQD
uniref:DNA polymerase n=1 Tax=Phellinus igniarius TaxID=40472 RepID=UPI00233F6B72|nr:DNA polymerase [Phellinus igniarius]WBU93186.1 DNA polymerase [Phellinus igniarius]